jgi:regulator of sirC expression with transglutaminase-like and TPR domain
LAELTDLLITPAPEIERVALAIAQDACPGLDPRRYLRELDGWSEGLRAPLARRADLDGRCEALVDLVYRGLGFRNVQEDGGPPEGYLLNEVIDRREGFALSLGIVLVAVARRAGLPAELLGLPAEVLVRVGGREGLVIDPSSLGRRVSNSELGQRARRLLPPETRRVAITLGALDGRQTALRLLGGLQQAYESRGEHGRALVACDRLVDITTDPRHRRDRGLHALALGANRAAAADLEAYLGAEPDAPDAKQIQAWLRHALGTRWRSLQ